MTHSFPTRRSSDLAYNVSGLGEVAEIEALMFSFAQKFNRRTELEFSNESAILPNPCYRLPFFSFANVLRLFNKCISNYFKFVKRSEEHTSELQSLMRISYAVFCLKKKKIQN